MPYEVSPLTATGNVRSKRFVKQDSSVYNGGAEADANEVVIGISGENARDTPGLTGASANHAEALDPITYNPIGSVCLLEIGSGGCTAGGELKSDADGKGVARASTGTTLQNVGAIALETASEGEFAKVLVHRSSVYPALA